jgi:hypothetical protein
MPSGAVVGGNVRVHKATINLAGQATTDTIMIAVPRKGETFLYGVMTTSATLGAAATVAIGIVGATAKYKAAAVFETTDTPTFFGKAAAMTELTADEEIFITIGTAALAASGTFVVEMFFAQS